MTRVKSKYFVRGNEPQDIKFRGMYTLGDQFCNNFDKDKLYIYMKAVVEFNKLARRTIFIICENAYDIIGNHMPDCYSLRFADKSWDTYDLTYFWALLDIQLYRYRYITQKNHIGDKNFHIRYWEKQYKEAKEILKQPFTLVITRRIRGVVDFNQVLFSVKIK